MFLRQTYAVYFRIYAMQCLYKKKIEKKDRKMIYSFQENVKTIRLQKETCSEMHLKCISMKRCFAGSSKVSQNIKFTGVSFLHGKIICSDWRRNALISLKASPHIFRFSLGDRKRPKYFTLFLAPHLKYIFY